MAAALWREATSPSVFRYAIASEQDSQRQFIRLDFSTRQPETTARLWPRPAFSYPNPIQGGIDKLVFVLHKNLVLSFLSSVNSRPNIGKYRHQFCKGNTMKKFQLALVGLAILSTSAFGGDSGPLEKNNENIFRFESSSEDGKCKTYAGPKRMEAFKASDGAAKVAEFTSLAKVHLCQGDEGIQFTTAQDIVVQNTEGYHLSHVDLKLEVKDASERRIGSRQAVTPTLASTCGNDKKTLPALSSTITAEQFEKVHLLVLEIGGGLWNTCE